MTVGVGLHHGGAFRRHDAAFQRLQVGGERVEIVVTSPADVEKARSVLSGLSDGTVEIDSHTRRLTAPVTGGATVLMEALRRLDGEGVGVSDVALRRPTLDDVFLTLTGHGAVDDDMEAAQ